MVTVRSAPRDRGWLCEVQVDHGGQRTTHEVTVSAAELARWGRGASQPDVDDLVRRSFAFLLEREPPSSILRRFDLGVIQRYFPEYDGEISALSSRDPAPRTCPAPPACGRGCSTAAT